MSAIRHRVLVTPGASTTDATSHTTASMTPTSGRVVRVCYFTRVGSGTPVEPTFSGTNGFNGTFTVRATVKRGNCRLTLATVTAVSGTAGTITCNPGETTIGWSWHVIEDVACTVEAPVQTKTANANAASLDLTGDTLAAFASEFNSTICWAATAQSYSSIRSADSQGTMAQLGSQNSPGVDGSVMAFANPAEVSSPLTTFTGAAADCLMIAAELDHDGSGLSGGGLITHPGMAGGING